MKIPFCRSLLAVGLMLFCFAAWNAEANKYLKESPDDSDVLFAKEKLFKGEIGPARVRDLNCPGGRGYIGTVRIPFHLSVYMGEPTYKYGFYWDWYDKNNLMVDPEHSIRLSDLRKYPNLYDRFMAMKPINLDFTADMLLYEKGRLIGTAEFSIKGSKWQIPITAAGEIDADLIPGSPRWNDFFRIKNSSYPDNKSLFTAADHIEFKNLKIVRVEWGSADGIIHDYLNKEKEKAEAERRAQAKAEEEKKALEEKRLAERKAMEQELARKKEETQRAALEEEKSANKRALEEKKLDNRTVSTGINTASKTGSSPQPAVSNPFAQTPKNITLPSSPQKPPMSKDEAKEEAINKINKTTLDWLENMNRNNKNLNLSSQPSLPELKNITIPSQPKSIPSFKSTYKPSSNPQETLDRINKINNDSINWLNTMNQMDKQNPLQSMMDISARANEEARQRQLNEYFARENRIKELEALTEDAKSRAREVGDAMSSLSSQWSSISGSYKKQLNEIDSNRNQLRKAKNDLNQWLVQMEETWKKDDAVNKAEFEKWEQQVEEQARKDNAWSKKQTSLEDLSRSKVGQDTPFKLSGTNQLKNVGTGSGEKGSLLKSIQKAETEKNTRGSLLTAVKSGATNQTRGSLLAAGKNTTPANGRGSLLNSALTQPNANNGLKSMEDPFMLEVRLAREKQEHREDFERTMASLQAQRQEVRQKVKARMAEYDQALTQLDSSYKTVKSNYDSASDKYDREYERLEKRQESLESEARRYQAERRNVY